MLILGDLSQVRARIIPHLFLREDWAVRCRCLTGGPQQRAGAEPCPYPRVCVCNREGAERHSPPSPGWRSPQQGRAPRGHPQYGAPLRLYGPIVGDGTGDPSQMQPPRSGRARVGPCRPPPPPAAGAGQG